MNILPSLLIGLVVAVIGVLRERGAFKRRRRLRLRPPPPPPRERPRLEPLERVPDTRDRGVFGDDEWGISARHRDAVMDEAKLTRRGLPPLKTEMALAAWLGISLSRLRWFTWDRPAERTWHYVRYVVPKRKGGERVILAPRRELKALQRKVLHDLLDKVPPSDTVHGFVRGRSIRTNAEPHVGHDVLLKLDLKDFFPSITFPRVRGLFIALGYPFGVASALALLLTEHDRVPYERDGIRYYVSLGPRTLIQGAPTSPAIANLVAWRLDRRLAGLARKHGFTYTRYADDLTFSGPDVKTAQTLLAAAQGIVRAEHFEIRPDKTRLLRKGGRHLVTGVVVNQAVGTPRDVRRRLRAILHDARRHGLEAARRDRPPRFRAWLNGMIGYIQAINPQQAKRLQQQLKSLPS